MQKNLKAFETYILYLVVFLVPLVVSSAFVSPFILPKLAILFFGGGIILILKSLRLASSPQVEVKIGSFDLGLLILATVYFLGALVVTPNKMEAFFLPGSATIFLAATLFYFFVNQMTPAEKKGLTLTLFFSGVATSLALLLAVSGVLAKIPQLPAFVKSATFTPIADNLSTAIFLGTLLPLAVGLIIKEKEIIKKLFFSVTFIVLIFGLAVAIFQSLPGKPTSPALPDFESSWVITIDALKEKPILGIGPGNYLTAFNRFRPVSYNQNKFWDLRFDQARSLYLTIATEVGLVGLVGLMLVAYPVSKTIKSTVKSKDISLIGNLVSLLGLLVLIAVFPTTLPLIFLVFLLLGLNAPSKKTTLINIRGAIVAIPTFIFLIFIFFQASKALAAEVTFKKSLDALARNDGQKTYDLMRSAIQKNPRVDRYHASFAQLNLALAQAMANQQGNKEVSEETRNTISQLIQQAIAEGKATAALNPQRAENWEIMAGIYRAIMPFAQGADTFAVQALKQAIAFDPVNPALRISLGGIYYALGNYDDALDTFKVATIAKADYANAYYNLAITYREKGEIDKAIAEMKLVLSLVKEGTNDYTLAKSELEALEKNKKQTPATETEAENLQAPEQTEQVITPPLELPEETTP